MKCPENYLECVDYQPELPLESRCQRDSNMGYCVNIYQPKPCKVCGELFVPIIKHPHQKYCSIVCRKEYIKEYQQKPEVKKYKKEYRQRPEIKKYQKKYQKKYNQRLGTKERRKEYRQRPEIKKYYQKPEVKERIKQTKKRLQIKRGLEQLNNSIYTYDDNGSKIGFKPDWFYEKYPTFTWDIYKELGWIEKSLEILNDANRICKGCGAHAMEVHHWKNFYKYPEIALKNSNLVALCVFCHKEIHNKNKRYSLKIKELNKLT